MPGLCTCWLARNFGTCGCAHSAAASAMGTPPHHRQRAPHPHTHQRAPLLLCGPAAAHLLGACRGVASPLGVRGARGAAGARICVGLVLRRGREGPPLFGAHDGVWVGAREHPRGWQRGPVNGTRCMPRSCHPLGRRVCLGARPQQWRCCPRAARMLACGSCGSGNGKWNCDCEPIGAAAGASVCLNLLPTHARSNTTGAWALFPLSGCWSSCVSSWHCAGPPRASTAGTSAHRFHSDSRALPSAASAAAGGCAACVAALLKYACSSAGACLHRQQHTQGGAHID
jgi:hypothetical protein